MVWLREVMMKSIAYVAITLGLVACGSNSSGSSGAGAVSAAGHPFYIKTVQGTGTNNAYDSGVTGNGMDVGNVSFTVPADAPATLFCDCSLHAEMTGTIQIVD